jgi:hypothetical protein
MHRVKPIVKQIPSLLKKNVKYLAISGAIGGTSYYLYNYTTLVTDKTYLNVLDKIDLQLEIMKKEKTYMVNTQTQKYIKDTIAYIDNHLKNNLAKATITKFKIGSYPNICQVKAYESNLQVDIEDGFKQVVEHYKKQGLYLCCYGGHGYGYGYKHYIYIIKGTPIAGGPLYKFPL